MVSSLTVASSLPLCNFTPQQRFLSALARVSRTSFYLVMVAPVTNAVDALWMCLSGNSQFAVPGFKLRKGATEVQQQRLARCDEWRSVRADRSRQIEHPHSRCCWRSGRPHNGVECSCTGADRMYTGRYFRHNCLGSGHLIFDRRTCRYSVWKLYGLQQRQWHRHRYW